MSGAPEKVKKSKRRSEKRIEGEKGIKEENVGTFACD